MSFRIVITIHFQPDLIYRFLVDFTPPIESFASGMLGRHVYTNSFDFFTDKIVYEKDRELKPSVRFKQLGFHN